MFRAAEHFCDFALQTEFTLPDIKWLHDAEAIQRCAEYVFFLSTYDKIAHAVIANSCTLYFAYFLRRDLGDKRILYGSSELTAACLVTSLSSFFSFFSSAQKCRFEANHTPGQRPKNPDISEQSMNSCEPSRLV